MALTNADIHLWDTLEKLKVIPPTPLIIELGEANWFGDCAPPPGCADADPFAVAKKFYKHYANYSEIISIDLQGTPQAVRLDLNTAQARVMERAHIVINSGTAEHVFNQFNFFRYAHDCCRPGGLMIHALPVLNWPNHGFYTYSPCMIDDLRDANEYSELARFNATFVQLGTAKITVEVGRAGNGFPIMEYVVFRKTLDSDFRSPMQRSLGL